MKFIEMALSDKAFRLVAILSLISLIAGQWISMWRCKNLIERIHVEISQGITNILMRQTKAKNEIENAIVAIRSIETFMKKRNK